MKLAREGNSPSTIGVLLRDRYAVPLVRSVTGKTVKQILGSGQQSGALPEDLATLVKKADDLRKHLEKNRKLIEEKGSSAFPSVMGSIMSEVRGKTDPKIVTEILKRKLSKAE